MCRVLSEIHSSLIASLMRGRMRMTSRPRESMRIAEPIPSITSIDFGLCVFPRTRMELCRLRGQRANGAKIDDIALQFRSQRVFEIGGDLHVLAAANRAELGNAGDFGGEANAARAMDAAVHRGLDERADIFVFDRALVLGIARSIDAIAHRLILQVAFAALIADRAIERMVDQQEFHHALRAPCGPSANWSRQPAVRPSGRGADPAPPSRRTRSASAGRPSLRRGTCGNCRRSTAARENRSAAFPRPPPRTPATACIRRERRFPCRR